MACGDKQTPRKKGHSRRQVRRSSSVEVFRTLLFFRWAQQAGHKAFWSRYLGLLKNSSSTLEVKVRACACMYMCMLNSWRLTMNLFATVGYTAAYIYICTAIMDCIVLWRRVYVRTATSTTLQYYKWVENEGGLTDPSLLRVACQNRTADGVGRIKRATTSNCNSSRQ